MQYHVSAETDRSWEEKTLGSGLELWQIPLWAL